MNKKSKKKPSRIKGGTQLYSAPKTSKWTIAIYLILRTITIGVMIRAVFLRQWESVFTCILTLALFLIPSILERRLKIDLPSALETVAFCFIFCAEILGEIGCYYVKYKHWDSMLHTVSGFIFAAFGFCLVDMLNRNKRIRIELSPASLAVVAFCFSMTTGVFWEFLEFLADLVLHTDMQKDFIVGSFSTVLLDKTSSNIPVEVNEIASTLITLSDGSTVLIEGGYIDIGLADTMKDLFVNFIGAAIFSFIGYFYVRHRGKGKIAPKFIPVLSDEDTEKTEDNSENGNNATDIQVQITNNQ